MHSRPTDILSDEHRVIEQVLDCLERMADDCRQRGVLDAAAAKDAVDFFRNFADRCHHGKEESHLFPALEAKGFSRSEGPTGVMLREHDQGRACVRGMDEAIDAAAAGNAGAQRRFVEHATHYIDLLREHIQKEDHCLFAMANQVFTDSEQRELLSAFTRTEDHDIGAGTHEKYLALANALAERFGAIRVRAATAARPHACGHHR